MSENIFTPDQQLRALSWKQPFASLMLHGKIETRTWGTKYRGWVLICASKKPYMINDVISMSGANVADSIFDMIPSNDYLEGKAVAIGRLVDCVHAMDLTNQCDWDMTFVKFDGNKYLHIYNDVQAITPFDWKGSQGWREVPIEIKQRIELI